MMSKLTIAAVLAAVLLASAGVVPLRAEGPSRTPLKPFTVTVRVFDPAKGVASGQDYILPVDSPDAEHAAASTMANAVSFTTKIEGGKPLSVAFTCLKIEPR